jgi:ABC-type branched-subunit amino acid transport system substrate-binding protein
MRAPELHRHQNTKTTGPTDPVIRTHAASARVRRAAVGLGLALIAVLPTACGGSALDPSVVRSANAALDAQAASAAGTTVAADGAGGTQPGDPSSATGAVGANPPGPGAGTGATGAPAGGSTAPGKAAALQIKAGSCQGLQNQTGITDTTIRIGNAADISGPVPGLFTSAQQAVKAYVAYFNATSNICGRKLALDSYDSRTDAGGDQQAYQKACESDFATIGSISAFDSGGASAAAQCGLPDLRSMILTNDRQGCATCFAASSGGPKEVTNSWPDFFVKNYHDASQKAAFLYLNAGGGAETAQGMISAYKKRGMNFLYTSGIDVAEFNYGPYVQAMKSKGVRWVQFIGNYQNFVRLAQAMQQGGFKPDVFFGDSTVYNPDYVKTGGSAVDGTMVGIDFTPFEEAGSNPELQQYLRWLGQVAPGAKPTVYGLYAWSAAKLFVQESAKLGGKLSRASLVADLKTVDKWTAAGMHAPQPVGSKRVGGCFRFLQLHGTTWAPVGGNQYLCTGATQL